jgi:ankyrin repeat protein
LDAFDALDQSDFTTLRDAYQRILCGEAANNGYYGRLAESLLSGMRFEMDSYTSALIAAVASRDMSLLKTLLRRHADVRRCWPFGNPLCLAIKMANEAAVALLLESGKNIEAVDVRSRESYRTLGPILVAAVAAESMEVLKKLICQYPAVLREGSFERSLLSLAAEKGKTAIVKFLLEQPGINPAGSDGSAWPPIVHAAQHGHVDIVKMFMAHESTVESFGSGSLRRAAMMGHNVVVQLLIEHPPVSPNKLSVSRYATSHRAMPEDRADNGGQRTALSYAAEGGYTKVVRVLLESRETAVNLPDSRGRTALYYAAASGNTALVQLFLDREDRDLDHEKNGFWNPFRIGCAKRP